MHQVGRFQSHPECMNEEAKDLGASTLQEHTENAKPPSCSGFSW